MNACELTNKKCKPCEGGVDPITGAALESMMTNVPGWRLDASKKAISKLFTFERFEPTMAFANAVAWIAIHEDHHPDMRIGYKTCEVIYTTHAIDGLSENDFICAAKVDALIS